jgi:hypothetical protein
MAERSCDCLQSSTTEFNSRSPLHGGSIFNRDWHLANKFPREGTEEEKNKWREEHRKKCTCGRKKK